MSDQSDVPAIEPGEAAQDAATESASPPWGTDFDAERAWKTIQTLRPFEKQAKEFERIQSDEQARAEWLKSLGYELADDEDEDSEEELFEDDDPVKPLNEKLTRLEQWQEKQEAKEMAVQIRTDLDDINKDSDWDLDDEDRQDIVSRAARDPKGFNRDALERAHKAFTERLARAEKRNTEQYRNSKKAPTPPPTGKAGEQAFDRKTATDAQRRKNRTTRIAAALTAQQQE